MGILKTCNALITTECSVQLKSIELGTFSTRAPLDLGARHLVTFPAF